MVFLCTNATVRSPTGTSKQVLFKPSRGPRQQACTQLDRLHEQRRRAGCHWSQPPPPMLRVYGRANCSCVERLRLLSYREFNPRVTRAVVPPFRPTRWSAHLRLGSRTPNHPSTNRVVALRSLFERRGFNAPTLREMPDVRCLGMVVGWSAATDAG